MKKISFLITASRNNYQIKADTFLIFVKLCGFEGMFFVHEKTLIIHDYDK